MPWQVRDVEFTWPQSRPGERPMSRRCWDSGSTERPMGRMALWQGCVHPRPGSETRRGWGCLAQRGPRHWRGGVQGPTDPSSRSPSRGWGSLPDAWRPSGLTSTLCLRCSARAPLHFSATPHLQDDGGFQGHTAGKRQSWGSNLEVHTTECAHHCTTLTCTPAPCQWG